MKRLYFISLIIYCLLVCIFTIGLLLIGNLFDGITNTINNDLVFPILYCLLTVGSIISFYKIPEDTRSWIVLKYFSSLLIFGAIICQIYFLVDVIPTADNPNKLLGTTIPIMIISILSMIGILNQERS